MIIIRNADLSDIEALLTLLEQLGYPTTKESLEKRFAKFLSNEGYGVAVAYMNSKIVGFVAWSQSNLFVADKIRIHIEGIAVDKEYRGQDVGKQLMQFVEIYAQKFSPAIIDLTSGLRRANEGTHEFYKIVYLALQNAKKKWTMPIKDWSLALNQFFILFPERCRV